MSPATNAPPQCRRSRSRCVSPGDSVSYSPRPPFHTSSGLFKPSSAFFLLVLDKGSTLPTLGQKQSHLGVPLTLSMPKLTSGVRTQPALLSLPSSRSHRPDDTWGPNCSSPIVPPTESKVPLPSAVRENSPLAPFLHVVSSQAAHAFRRDFLPIRFDLHPLEHLLLHAVSPLHAFLSL